MDNDVLNVADYRSYQGGYFRVLVNSSETGGAFSLLEMTLPKGVEPPPHIHANEDETFFLLEGQIKFFIGGKETTASAGEAVFAPRTIKHHFAIQTDAAKFLSLITPGGLQDYFIEFSEPARNLELTPPAGPPPADIIEIMTKRISSRYGVQFI